MKVCPACGNGNSDAAKFCDGCGVVLASTPSAAEASPVAVTDAPPAPPAYAPPAPPAYAPPAAPVVAAAPTSRKAWMPWVIGLVVMVLAVGGYFGYTAFFKGGPGSGGPLSAPEYRTQALKYSNDLLSAGAGTDATAISQMASTDPTTRATAKEAWDRSLAQARAAMASIRALVPPAEYVAMQSRILKGAAANERILNALDPLMSKLAAGGVTTSEVSASAEYQAVSDILADTSWTADAADFAKALTELKSEASATVAP